MKNVRDLALAAMLSAALYAGTALAPGAAAVLIWVVPLPGLLLASVRPREISAWLLLTSASLALAIDVTCAFSFIATLGIATVVVAAGVARGWTLERSLAGAIVACTLGMATIYLLTVGDWTTAMTAATTQIDEAFTLALEASRAAGADQKALLLLEGERQNVVQSVLWILPAMVTLTAGAILCANMAMARRLAAAFEDFRFRYWHAPEAMIWAFIAAGFAMFMPFEPLAFVAANAFVVLLGCYLLQGLAIVSYYLERFALPMPLRVGTYLLIGVQQLLTAVVLALGIFDLWGDFRRLHSQPTNASLESDD